MQEAHGTTRREKPQDSKSARLPAPAPAEDWEAEPAKQEMQRPQKVGVWRTSDSSLKTYSTSGAFDLGQTLRPATLNIDLNLIQDSKFPKRSCFSPRITYQDCKAGHGLAGKGEPTVLSPFSL